MYLLNVLENRNATFQRAINHVIKSAILIGRNYLFNFSWQQKTSNCLEKNYNIFQTMR